MKRSDALKLIANQLNFLDGNFKGFELDLTEEQLNKANVILTTLEAAGMQPPNCTIQDLFPLTEVVRVVGKDETVHYYACWEPE
jgi:hypothetical protein